MHPTVFLSFASNFWPHSAVAVSSVLQHSSPINIHLFSDSSHPRWLQKLNSLATRSGADLRFHRFDASVVGNLKNCGHYGLATYYRLFIPDLFADTHDRLIYIDSDMVLRASIRELDHHDISGHVLAAVSGISASANATNLERLGCGDATGYFNAGLMLINPALWRRQDITQQCLHFFDQHPERIRYADQDMLNYCLAGQWQKLPIEWNMLVDNYGPIASDDLEDISLEQLEHARLNPKVIHFNGQFKPWHFTYRHPFKSEYVRTRRSLQKTPYISDDFPGFLPEKLLRRCRNLIR